MLIRWSRIIPRLVLLFLVLAAAWWGRDELVRWQIGSNIKQQTGADVEIGSVKTDWQRGIAVVGDVRIFDPKAPNRELLRAEKISVQGSSNDFLLRYFRFPEVNIDGIRITIEGTDGQELIPDRLWSKMKDRIPNEFGSIGELDWSAFLSDNPEVAAKNLLQQLETSRLLDDLKKRWPNEVQRFESVAAALKQRLRNVKGLSENTKNSADKLQLLEAVLKELEGVDLGLRQFFEDTTKLKSLAQGDYQLLINAAQRDQEKIKKLQTPKIDADRLSEVLIGSEVREQWNKTVAWGDWARSLLIPVNVEDQTTSIYDHFGLTPPKKFRGENISLTALDTRSELLIETTNLTGQILFGTFPVYFNGTVKNIANPATFGPAPMTAQFCFSGSGIPASSILPETAADVAAEQLPAVLNPDIIPNIYVTLNVDRLGENDEDQMIICCPMYQLSERVLGDPEKLAINVSPGTSRLDGVLILQGEKLSGEIRIVQSNIRLAVVVSEKRRNSEFQRILQQSLDSIGDLTATVLVSGTRTEPMYVFKSNIADLIRPRIDELVKQEWDSLRQETERLILEEANQGAGILNTAFQEKIDPMMNDLNGARSQWEQKVAQISDVPFDQLVQSQLSNLSPKDQQRLGNLLQSPSVQALLQKPGQPEQPAAPVDQLIQRSAEKLQDKIPGLLDKLRKKSD